MPMALVFFITGAFLAVDIKGGKKSDVWAYQVKGAYTLTADEFTRSVVSQIDRRGISLRLGNVPEIKISNNGDKSVSWNIDGSRVKASVKKTSPESIILKVKHASLFNSFLDLHKTEKGVLYTTYVFISSIALIILSITGFFMIIKNKRQRGVGLLSVVAGTLLYVLLILF